MRPRWAVMGLLLASMALSACAGSFQHRESAGTYCRADVRCPYGDR